jgi:hypothetical protein
MGRPCTSSIAMKGRMMLPASVTVPASRMATMFGGGGSRRASASVAKRREA